MQKLTQLSGVDLAPLQNLQAVPAMNQMMSQMTNNNEIPEQMRQEHAA